MNRSVLVLAAVLGTVGCYSYRGGARAIDPSRLTEEPGWTVAAATPSVRQTGRLDCGAAALAMVSLLRRSRRERVAEAVAASHDVDPDA